MWLTSRLVFELNDVPTFVELGADAVSAPHRLEIDMGRQDELELGSRADPVGDVHKSVPEFDNRRLLDKEDRVNAANPVGHTTPPTLKNAEPFIVPSILSEVLLPKVNWRFLPKLNPVFVNNDLARVAPIPAQTEAGAAVAPIAAPTSSPVTRGD